MIRARTTIALAAVLAFAAALAVPAAADAATPTSMQAALADPTKAEVSAKIVYVPSAGATPVRLSPNSQVSVTFWRLDPATNLYQYGQEVAWTDGAAGAADTSAPLDPGTYAIRFLASDAAIGGQWWQGKRYFYESGDITLSAGQSLDLGTITLQKRTFDVDRISGQDRFSTAVAASQWAIPDGSSAPVVYLANGLNYPDALAAGPGAIKQGGVLLLTQPDALPAMTVTELHRLAPQRVVVVGGTGAVSASVLNAVKSTLPGVPVTRLGGAGRYETAQLVIQDAFKAGDSNVALVATGANYPDALAAGPAAGYLGAPVVLTNGTGTLPAATEQFLASLKVDTVLIVGGPGAVSLSIESRLTQLYGADHVMRFSGASRYETAEALNAGVFDPTDFAFVASGANFPDALAGAPVAGMMAAPLYLTKPSCLSPEADAGITASRANGLVLLGGTGALSKTVEAMGVCG